jgi:hypothetical protein
MRAGTRPRLLFSANLLFFHATSRQARWKGEEGSGCHLRDRQITRAATFPRGPRLSSRRIYTTELRRTFVWFDLNVGTSRRRVPGRGQARAGRGLYAGPRDGWLCAREVMAMALRF